MDLGRRAAAGGEAATADEAFAAAAGLGARWGPRTAEAVEWILDRQAAPEWGLVAVTPSGAAASGRPDYAANYEMLSQVLPEVGRRADLQYERYRWLAAQGSVDEAALRRARQAAEASGDAVWAATVKMESWIQGGRRGEAPVAAVSLRPGEKRKSNNKAGDIYVAPTTATAITTASAGGAWGFENSTVPAGQMVDLGSQMAVAVREESGGLVLDFFGRAAQGAWVTIDMGRTGRTALAEPVVEWETPRVTRQATAGSPLWVRSAALWTRTEKDGRIMLRLGYAALGGRPPRGTVWLVTVRRETVPGLRPQVWPELKNGGCWAVMFD
jgi:hypothetical protein